MLKRLKISFGKSRPHLVSVILLCLSTIIVYGQVLGHEFLSNWDDNKYVLENPDIYGISWVHLKAVFTSYYSGNYAPVHMLSYMLDYTLWGLWPGGYLLTNLLLHIINGLLIYRLFLRLVGGRLAACAGAAFFLLHPVQVETVAWISQRKNLLAMLFFLIAWEFYRSYRQNDSSRGRLYYAASLIALLLALLSKSVAVIFPIVIIAFEHCFHPATRRSRMLGTLPFLVFSAVFAAVALHSQTPDYIGGIGGGRTGYHGGSAVSTFYSMLPVFCHYLGLIIWPTGLSSYYSPALHHSPDLYVAASALLLVAVCFACYRLYRYDRRAGFWPFFFLIALLPVSQIVPLVTMMNDRYLYFPIVGIAALAGCAVEHIRLQQPQRISLSATLLAGLLVILACISYMRVPVWKDARTLWSDAASKTPDVALVWEGLGEAYHYSAKPDRLEAVKAYSRASELSPENEISQYNLGVAYIELTDYASAEKVLLALLKRNPGHVLAWTAYGDLALHRSNDYAESEKRYKKARDLQPEAVQVHRKIAGLMSVTGRLAEAKDSLLRIEALQGGTDPHNAYELARIESQAGDTGSSVKWLEQALQRGYNDYSGIIADEELTPVRSDGRFADLVTRYFPK